MVIHWGKLGEPGLSETLAATSGEAAEALIERESRSPRLQGFAEIDIDDHVQVIVQFKTDHDWGDSADLEKRHRVEDILNECLGWSGNGHCDGGDIGSGTINAFSFVVDPQLAQETIISALKREGLLEGAIIALDRTDGYEVMWPVDFDGEFSLF